jgi:hypothetical protein
MSVATQDLELALAGGGRALVLESDGAGAVLISTHPLPPGATLVGESADDGVFSLKVRGCRRESTLPPEWRGESAFRIVGRWVNLSRAQRERLLAGRR